MLFTLPSGPLYQVFYYLNNGDFTQLGVSTRPAWPQIKAYYTSLFAINWEKGLHICAARMLYGAIGHGLYLDNLPADYPRVIKVALAQTVQNIQEGQTDAVVFFRFFLAALYNEKHIFRLLIKYSVLYQNKTLLFWVIQICPKTQWPLTYISYYAARYDYPDEINILNTATFDTNAREIIHINERIGLLKRIKEGRNVEAAKKRYATIRVQQGSSRKVTKYLVYYFPEVMNSVNVVKHCLIDAHDYPDSVLVGLASNGSEEIFWDLRNRLNVRTGPMEHALRHALRKNQAHMIERLFAEESYISKNKEYISMCTFHHADKSLMALLNTLQEFYKTSQPLIKIIQDYLDGRRVKRPEIEKLLWEYINKLR